MAKPSFLLSDHAIERRGAGKDICLKELEYGSEEIGPGLARPLLGRAGLKARRFPGSRFWIVNNEWMYISQASPSSDIQLVTTCIHIFDRTRQAILKGESLPTSSTVLRYDQPYVVEMGPKLKKIVPEGLGYREAFEQMMLRDWVDNQKRRISAEDYDGNLILLIRSVNQENSTLYLNLASVGWEIRLSRGIEKAFPHEDDQRSLKEAVRIAHQNNEEEIKLELETGDAFPIIIIEDPDCWMLYAQIPENTNTPDPRNWVELSEIE
jgi:hypothetical protein